MELQSSEDQREFDVKVGNEFAFREHIRAATAKANSDIVMLNNVGLITLMVNVGLISLIQTYKLIKGFEHADMYPKDHPTTRNKRSRLGP